MRAGCVLTAFSLAALLEVANLPDVKIVRTVVEGLRGSLELWNCRWLNDQTNRSDAESVARKLGLERWISAEGAGIHALGWPEPRVFFRRGAADRHVLDVVAFDASSRRYLDQKEHEISELKGEVRYLKSLFDSKNVKRASVIRRTVSKALNRYRSRR